MGKKKQKPRGKCGIALESNSLECVLVRKLWEKCTENESTCVKTLKNIHNCNYSTRRPKQNNYPNFDAREATK